MKLNRLRKIEVTYNVVPFMQQQNNSFGLCYFKKFERTNFAFLHVLSSFVVS